ncbi:MAG: hypothetical protein ABSE45_00315 [Candidatus Acidiferrales bacterium]
MRRSIATAAIAAMLLGGISARTARAQNAAAPQGPCDRACLRGMVDMYIAAMVKHDPSGLPLATGYKYTENTAAIQLGDGLWVGASEAPTTFKIYALDPTSQQAGLFAVMKEWDKPIILALRLKIEDGKIAEIEHVIARNLRDTSMPNLTTPRPGLIETVPPAERVSRDEMYRIADSYFEAIEHSDGNLAPFADDCVRHENGMQTTSNTVLTHDPSDPAGAPIDPLRAKIRMLGCRDNINSHTLSYITKIQPRRLIIIDEEKGLVFGFPMFVHRGNVRSIKIVGVPGLDTIPMTGLGTSDLEAGEIFKIRAGKIHEIEAMGFILPYGSKTGWE